MAPEPTWPAMQVTVPRSAMRLKSRTTGGTCRFLIVSAAPPDLLCQVGYISPMLRPSIISIRWPRSISEVAAGADEFAVAQHRDGVADFKNLAEPMRDVDDRLAFGLQRSQCVENPLDLDVGERGGRLVENKARGRRGSACGRFQRADGGRCSGAATGASSGRSRQADLIERCARLLAQALAPMKQRHLAVAEPDVVEHRQGGREAQLLRHQRDAEFLSVLRILNSGRLVVDQDHALIRRVQARQNFDEGAFAGAVLAADGVDLARIKRQADVLENRVGSEPLGDSLRRQGQASTLSTSSLRRIGRRCPW